MKNLVYAQNSFNITQSLDAELSKGSAAWQSISRKSDMLKPDTARVRDNTEMDKAVFQLQKVYDSLMSTYGKEMKAALGYHASANNRPNYNYFTSLKQVTNEDGTSTVYKDEFWCEDGQPFPAMDKTGTLEFEKLNPQNIDFKVLANELTVGETSVQPENVLAAQQSVETTHGYNHGSLDAKTYMKVRGRRGSYSTVEIKTHVEANKIR